jgi:hypothetical protein
MGLALIALRRDAAMPLKLPGERQSILLQNPFQAA